MSLIFRSAPRVAAALVLVALRAVPVGALVQDEGAAVRRLAALTAIAADEYALGVADGRVLEVAELEEARLFLAEARDLAATLTGPVGARATAMVDTLRATARTLGPPEALRRGVDRLRAFLAAELAIALDPMPHRPPALALGASVYAANCTKCHGDRGAGDGPRAAALDPPPADLTVLAPLRSSSPVEFFRKITFGVSGTDMPSFEDGLSLEERWAVALYTSGFRYSDAERLEGAAWFADTCARCLPVVSGFEETVLLSDDALAVLLARRMERGRERAPGVPALAYARTAAAADVLGTDRGLAGRRMGERVAAGIDSAVALGEAGDARAAGAQALSAYLEFERVESVVGARSGGAARAVELAFADFRGALAAGDAGRVLRARGQLVRALDRAVEVMSASSAPTVLFGQSLLIILREGLEAILIVGALVAFLLRAGAGARVREISLGVLGAGLASLATAGAFATVWRASSGHREALEGLTMLAASLVLFTVASWVVSKVEAKKWQRFVRSRMERAMSGGSALALAGVAFLAVYREGFETVLFYGALFGTAKDPAGAAGIVVGLGVGLVLLAALFLAIRRYGVRIPLRPFFAVTGLLLTLLAVSFAGQGVAELQGAGWIPLTPIARLPALPALGVFPTVQTVLAQVAVTAAFGAAFAWIFWLSPGPSARAVPPA